jgi:CRP-like cAMP-binding protein
MLGRTHDPKMASKMASKTASKTAAAIMPLAVQRFRREGFWGAAMLAALLVAALAAQSDVGAQRAARILASLNASPETTAHAFDAEAATRQLTQAVRTLAQDRDRLAVRLAAVEHDMDDVTGSIKQQGDAAKTSQSGPAWPIDAPPVPMTPADIAAMVKSAAPPASRLATVGAPAPATTDTAATDTIAAVLPAYGADIGSAMSMKALQTHWTALRAAHPQLFDGMRPVVALRQNAHLNHTELHLLVGPYSSADAAAQFCGLLATYRVPCQPTMFDDRHLALQ